VPGSMEQFQYELREAIGGLGLFKDGFDIVATLPDSVVVCSYPAMQHYSIAYTPTDQGITLGALTPVDLTTMVTMEEADMGEPIPPAAPAQEGMDAEMQDQMDEGDYTPKAQSMEYKSFSLKSAPAEDTLNGVKGWTFEGYASVWDVEDAEHDVVRKGAFTRTLSEGLPLVKYEHGPTVGKTIAASEDDHGLYVKGFIPEDAATDFMRKLMKIGAVEKMSYGWKPYEGGAKRGPSGVRELTDLRLFEVSPVAIPMLDATSITSVKSLPNGLPDAPFDVQMSAAGAALLAAKGEAEALMKRRERRRDGQVEWPVSEKCLGAIVDLGGAAGETFVACLQAEVKAGRAVSGTRKRYLTALVQALSAFVDSLPDSERVEMEGLLGGKDDAGDGASKSAATVPDDEQDREVNARDLVADYLEAQLSRLAGPKMEMPTNG